MLSVLNHGNLEVDAFCQRNAAFFQNFESLQRLVDVLFQRVPPTDFADLIVFGLGRRIASDFDDILLLASERRGENALALVRNMFERLVTGRYIHNHPDEAEAFASFDFIQRRKLARRLLDTFGIRTENEERMQKLETEAKNVEDQFVIPECKQCGTTRLNHSWHRLDIVAMAANTEKRLDTLSGIELEEAQRTQDRFKSQVAVAYYHPMGQTHATFKSISTAFGEVGGELTSVLPEVDEIDCTVKHAHLLLLEGLLMVGQRLKPSGFDEAFNTAIHDFVEIWNSDAF